MPHKPTLFLLDAPINATWAANHGEVWQEKGFSGFLFEGLLDNLAPYPSELPSAADSTDTTTIHELIVPGDQEALIAEISGAVNRLKAAGLRHNFLRLTLTPEAPYFTDSATQEIAINRLHLAGEYCRQTGLLGIALDTQSQSALYDYRWDGHPEGVSPDTLMQGARQFGSSLLRAFIRAYPDCEILLLAQSPETSPPLWFCFLEGAVESVGAASAIPIRLALYNGGFPEEPEAYCNSSQRINNLFRRVLSPAAHSLWERQCGLSFSLKPVAYEGDMPTAQFPLLRYRRALYGAALYGNDYTIIHAPEGGWWHIPRDTAAQFANLHQGGRARVSFAPPVPITVDAYAPRLSIPDALHLGSIAVNGAKMEALQQAENMSLLAWEGLPRELQIAARASMITVTNLITEEQLYFTPDAEEIVLPAQAGMLLISGLPATAFALPASLRMRLKTPIQAGITRSELEVELHNPLALPLQGTLTLNTEPQYSLGSATFHLNIKPGESATFQRAIQGISYMGHRPVFSMNLYTGAEAPIVHSTSFPVEPPECFFLQMDGPVEGSPILFQEDGHTSPLLITGDMRGNLVCFDISTKQILWQTRVRGIYSQPPLLLKDIAGDPFVALQNEHGRCRFFNRNGEEKVMIYPVENSNTKMTTVSAPDSPAIYLVVAAPDGTISVNTPSGILKSRFEKSNVCHLASAPSLPDRLFIIASEDEPDQQEKGDPTEGMALLAYNLNAQLLWEETLLQPVPCPPIILTPDNGSLPMLCISDASGALILLDAQDGSLITNYHDTEDLEPTHLIALGNEEKSGTMFAKTDATSLALYSYQDSTIRRMWSLPLSLISAIAPLPDNDGVATGLADGSVYAFNIAGKMIWQDQQGVGTVTSLTLYTDQTRPDTCICVVTSRAGIVRGLEIKESLLSPEVR